MFDSDEFVIQYESVAGRNDGGMIIKDGDNSSVAGGVSVIIVVKSTTILRKLFGSCIMQVNYC